MLTTSAQFDNTLRFVGLAVVIPDSGMSYAAYHSLNRYSNLQLDTGVNCVYFGRRNGQWFARIATPKPKCDAAAANGSTNLNVISGPDEQPDSVLPAARIIEGKNMVPYLGFRCARAWCVIGPHEPSDLLTPVHAAGMEEANAPPMTIRTRLDVWFDEQHLAVFDSARNKLVARFRASIIPDTGLRHRTAIDYAKGYVAVASVYAATEPPAEYQRSFGYRRGWNRLFIRLDSVGGWWSMIIDGHDSVHVRQVRNFSPTVGQMPGTARFAWQDLDEWVWVPCDNGCCLVQDGDDKFM